MSTAGQNNIKGINSQIMAAMSLFLQYLRDPKFSYIHLEEKEFGDFYLVFNDGHKIICEVKDHKAKFSYADLLEVVRKVIQKRILRENDEILIICRNLDRNLENNVSHVKYFKDLVKSIFERKSFTKDEIDVLEKVKFWKVNTEINDRIIFYLFSELLNFWLPEDYLKQIIDKILIEKIYKGSEKGQTYKREEIIDEIENLRKTVIKDSGYFDQQRVSIEAQLSKILLAIKNNKAPEWAPNQLASISAQPNLIYFVLAKFRGEKIDNLEEWKGLWQINRVYGFSFDLFKIFGGNCHTRINQEYILKFVKNNLSGIRGFYHGDFFDFEITDLVNKVLDQNKAYSEDALNIALGILATYEEDYFYVQKRRDVDYDKEKVCKLIERIYNDANDALKHKIYTSIIKYFNLVEDEGEFVHYTHAEIFRILCSYLVSDWTGFESKLLKLTRELIGQFDKFYRKFGRKVRFEGWELMGGGATWWGHNYQVYDRHFVAKVLAPALSDYYKARPKQAWAFISKKCVSQMQNVSKKHPDFLNRAALFIILERYKEEDARVSAEALSILKEFILCRKGIPHKSELIYQILRGDFSDEKKLALVKISIEKYKIPGNTFIEQIVSELASKQDNEAKQILADWSKNSDYYEKTSFAGNNIVQNIQKLIEASFNDALEIFRNYTSGEYFINKLDSFNVYEVAGLLNTILKKNFQKGLEIIEQLAQKQNSTKNEQILLCHSILGSGEEKQEELEFLVRIYEEFVNPFLCSLNNDIAEIQKRIPHSNAREVFVRLAERLIGAKKLEYSFRIIEIFINDPDPFSPGSDPEDPEAKYSYHKKIVEEGTEEHGISSVRGWCAWTLAQCVILDGRNHIPRIIDLTERLLKDSDYYVIHMACFPLSQLVRNRLSHMPDTKDILFFNEDKRTALEMAKRVEKMAFELLGAVCGCSENVKKSLAKSVLSTFDSMKALNEKDALRLLEKMKCFPDECVSEVAWLFIYFAEFRKGSFKDWALSMPGLYDDLQPFDDAKFRAILKETMQKNGTFKGAFSWEFVRATNGALRKIKHSLDYEEAFNLSVGYLRELISEYDHGTFENAYRFIEENIEQVDKFDICYGLWKGCLKIERPALEKLVKEGRAREINWWPHYYNGKILMMGKAKKGDEEFLDSLEYLAQYPKELSIGDISEAVKLIKEYPYPHDRVEKIFNNLIERNSGFYNDKQEWISKAKVVGTN